MADTQKLAYKLAATISSAGFAAGVPIGASPATGTVDTGAYHTTGTSGQQHAILPKVPTVADTYSKTEIDSKLELAAEKAGRASDGISGKVDRVLEAIAVIGKDLADFKKDAKADASALRIEVRDDYKNTRNTLIGVAVGAVGIVLAIIALTYGMAGNMTTANGNVLAAFGAGKEAEAATREAAAAAVPPPKYDAQTGKLLTQ